MRHPALWFAFSLLLICPVTASTKTDREHDGFVGPVRNVRIEKSLLVNRSGNWVEESRVLWLTVAYDSSGSLAERIFYSSDGSVWSKIVYAFDTEGNRSDVVYRSGKGRSASADGSDQTQSLTEFTRLRRTFKYDSSGNRTEEADYLKGGNLSRKTLYRFDANGFVKEIIEYAPDGTMLSRYANKFDEKGSITEQRRDESPGATARKESYSYEFDSAGNWIRRVATTHLLTDGKRVNEAKEVIYRAITYDSSQSTPDNGRAIDRSTDVTGGTSSLLTHPILIRKSGGVLQGSAISRVHPTYPPDAIAQRISGSVVVEVTVDEDGGVIAARALSGPDQLRGAAVSAAREWKFHPTELSGMAVKVIGTITFNFNL